MRHRLVCIILCLVFSIVPANVDYAAGLQAGLTLIYFMIAPTIDTVTCLEIVCVQFLFTAGFVLDSDFYWQQVHFRLMLVLFFLTETYEIVEIVEAPFFLWTESRFSRTAAQSWRKKLGSLPL